MACGILSSPPAGTSDRQRKAKGVDVEPDEVLDLIHDAPNRYETVRAALRSRGDGGILRSLRERAAGSSDPTSRGSGRKEHPEPDGPFGWRCRIWHAGAYRWRRELDLPGGGTEVEACYGTDPSGEPREWRLRCSVLPSGLDPGWLDYAKDHYWTFYLVADISGIDARLDGLDLRVGGETQWAGRDAIRLLGAPPAGDWDDRDDPDPLAFGADEYELLVDAERGAILRHANRLEGKEFEVLEMEEVHFDERFAEEVLLPPQPLTCW